MEAAWDFAGTFGQTLRSLCCCVEDVLSLAPPPLPVQFPPVLDQPTDHQEKLYAGHRITVISPMPTVIVPTPLETATVEALTSVSPSVLAARMRSKSLLTVTPAAQDEDQVSVTWRATMSSTASLHESQQRLKRLSMSQAPSVDNVSQLLLQRSASQEADPQSTPPSRDGDKSYIAQRQESGIRPRRQESTIGPSEGCKALLTAVRANDVKVVKQLLSNPRTNVNEVDIDGGTPLLVACSLGHRREEIIETLLQARANPDIADREGATPLQAAASEGAVRIVKLLLASGTEIDSTDTDGCSALYLAAGTASSPGHLGCVEELLGWGANRTLEAKDGTTPITIALELDPPYRERVAELFCKMPEVEAPPRRQLSARELKSTVTSNLRSVLSKNFSVPIDLNRAPDLGEGQDRGPAIAG